MSVVQGIGNPRIITQPPTRYLMTELIGLDGNTATLGSGTLDSDCLNRRAIARTNQDELVTGKIIAYNNTLKTVTVDAWNADMGVQPDLNTRFIILGRVIDVPIPSLQLEEFTFQVIRNKKFNGDIGQTKKGFYYKCTLNYSIMSKSVLESLEEALNEGTLLFYPHKDNVLVWYYVRLNEDFKIHQRFKKHRDISIKLIGTERLDRINIIGEYGYGEYWGYWS